MFTARIIVLGLSACAIVIGCNSRGRVDQATASSSDVLAVADVLKVINDSPRVERVLNTTASLVDSLVLGDDHPISSIDIIATDSAGNLLVSDNPASNVHMLHPQLEYVVSFSTGRGRGPGELINPASIETGPGFVLVGDMVNRTVSKYDLSGRYLDRLQLDAQPYRVTLADTSLVVTLLSTSEVLRVYSAGAFDIAGKPEFQARLLPVTPDPRTIPLVAAGDSEYSQETLFHSLTFLPAVVTTEPLGGTFAVSPTIDAALYDRKLDDYLVQGAARISSQHYSGPIFFSRGLVWIHSRIASTATNSFIDRYRLDEGKLHYVDSVVIPGAIMSYTVNDSALYVTRNAGLRLEVYEVE